MHCNITLPWQVANHYPTGVVGLATARRLATLGHRVTVVEAESDSERHTSARGSWVIHSGIYYSPGSLKVPSGAVSFNLDT